jgi:hypothetical protein
MTDLLTMPTPDDCQGVRDQLAHEEVEEQAELAAMSPEERKERDRDFAASVRRDERDDEPGSATSFFYT